ncbi:MAG: TIGR04222 domain-containing membrane protein [Actinophytocola sp.]|uniref:TIGR04222 domain-containing membrane protein n=1 Tax=Actinophytocola sp. TaxID=1872138 RepID=UPI0013265F02|nr:TIGR04222 domain-containing membrane protein [Actinophytocola sp.]MPZ83641.1 TIGR04222 domain-containing membrane protein [Actinophytocola sp.]
MTTCGADAELSPAMAGYLARGPRRALLAVLVTLRRRSAVAVARSGMIKRTGPLLNATDPLERAVHATLSGPMGPGTLRRRTSVDEALVALREQLVARGLLVPRWRRLPFRRRTSAGSRALREVRRRYPVPAGDEPLPAVETGMVVALYGTLDLPGIRSFARRGGLHDRCATESGTSADGSYTSAPPDAGN